MEDLLDQIEQTNESGLYYLALLGVLIVPDICGALESENGEASGRKYRKWFRENVSPKGYTSEAPGVIGPEGLDTHDYLSPEDAYYFRCSFLHQGSTQHRDSEYARIAFAEPGYLDDMKKVHLNIEDEVLQIDVERFCEDVVSSARDWFAKNRDNRVVAQNLDRFVRRYPEGLLAFLPGVPVIS